MRSFWKHRSAALCGSAIFALAGCSDKGGPPAIVSPLPPTPTAAITASVYVIQNNNTLGTDQILKFAAGSSGSVTPALTLTTNLAVDAVAVDTSGQIYAGGVNTANAYTINVYPAGASGSATATRTITLATLPISMATDSAGSLYVADDSGDIFVYAGTASGAATPTRTISGANTTIGSPESLAVDATGAIYLSSLNTSGTGGSILVFAAGANGNVPPINSLTAPAGFAFTGVAVDASDNIDATTSTISGTNLSTLLEYSPGSTGAATPLRTISGSATTLSSGLSAAGALRLDTAGNMYLPLQTVSGSGYAYSVLEFSAGSNGNVAPYAQVSSASWNNASAEIAVQ